MGWPRFLFDLLNLIREDFTTQTMLMQRYGRNRWNTFAVFLSMKDNDSATLNKR